MACGSAHSVSWSSMQRKLTFPLPSKTPMELSHLQQIPIQVLRNRLILLQHFSNLFCKSITLFDLQSDHLSGHSIQDMELGFDRLRGIILSSSKVRQNLATVCNNLCML